MRTLLLSLILTATAMATPTINTQPVGQTKSLGQSVTFTVAATAGSGALSYQWRKVSVGTDVYNIPAVANSSATSASFTINAVQEQDAGVYSVLVTDSTGQVASNSIALTINGVSSSLWGEMVGYYTMDFNSLGDFSGLAKSGNISSSSSVANRAGVAGKAWYFNGTDTYGTSNAPVGTQGWPSGNSRRTVTLWFNAEVHAGYLFSMGADSAGQMYSLRLEPGGVLAFGGGTEAFTARYNVGDLAGTGWHHVAITTSTFVSGIQGNVFLDGVMLTSPQTTFSFTTSYSTNGTLPLILGSNPAHNADFFKGAIDDVRVYARDLGLICPEVYQAEAVPVFTTQPGSALNTPSGQAVAFNAATALPASLQWMKDGVAINGATSGSYSIAAAQRWHIGSYSVRATSPGGLTAMTATSSVANLTLQGVSETFWSGLIGYYPLNGNANDLSPIGRHGTLSGSSPAVTTDRLGAAGNAYAFTGASSQFISAAATAAAPWPSGTGARTISLWFKASQHAGNLFSMGRRSTNARFSVLLSGANTTFIGEGNDFSYNTGSFTGTGWNHLVITYGSSTGRVYINGTLKSNGVTTSWSKPTLVTDGTKPLYLAVNAEQQGEYFTGSLDEVRVYNRELSAAEVSSLNSYEGAEIAITGNSTLITSGDSTPSTADHTDFGITAISSGTVTRTFTISNSGIAGLRLTGNPRVAVSGTHAADFTVTVNPTATIFTSSTFQVRFDPSASGVRTAQLSIANEDADESNYTFAISGRGLSTADDTDGDGVDDVTEFQTAALGFDWQVSQTALLQTLRDNAPGLGLYSLTQVQQLNVGTPVLVRNNATGTFKLTFGLQQSNNLTNFTPMPFTSGTTTINGSGQIEFEFTPSGTAPSFYRVGAQ